MSKLQILRFPNPFLRNKGQPIKAVTPELVELGQNMLQLMYESYGVGLAAIQVGKPLALLTADTRIDFESPYYKPQNPSLQDSPPEEAPNRKPYERDSLSFELESKIKQPLILFNPKILKKKGSHCISRGLFKFSLLLC